MAASTTPVSPVSGHGSPSALAIASYFRKLRDPRRRHRRLHRLQDIIVIAICAVVSGANDWHQIVTFGRERHSWLQRFLALPHGIPAHDTFERVFDRLDPEVFQGCFRAWVDALCATLDIRHVAIDGKAVRGATHPTLGPLHLVGAWASANHLLLGEVAVADKSNEITAIPRLLELLDIAGALVTIDAMGCQKEIAAKIREKKADYVLTVKDNQPNLLEDIQDCFTEAFDTDFATARHDTYVTHEKGHGREETRSYTVLYDPAGLRNQEAWQDLCVIGLCVSERTIQGRTSAEVRYFIGSRRASAEVYARALRDHWGIENNLHWQMDVNFGEDASRVQRRHGAENFALLRRLALMMLKRHPDKRSIASKRLAAALNPDFLAEILTGGCNPGKP